MTAPRERVLALTYHDVTSDPDDSGLRGPEAAYYKVRPERFAEHLDAIGVAGLVPALATQATPAAGLRLFLTFDDGGRSGATVVAPALESRGWPAHFFLVTRLIGKPGFLSAAEVRELSLRGHDIGSHGHSHAALTRLTQSELEAELRRSRALLEDLLQESVTSLALPGGFYARRLDAAIASAGYRHVFTSEPWLRPRLRDEVEVYGRFVVHSRTSTAEVARLCRLSRSVVRRRGTGWFARKGARALLGPAYGAARSAALRRRARHRESG